MAKLQNQIETQIEDDEDDEEQIVETALQKHRRKKAEKTFDTISILTDTLNKVLALSDKIVDQSAKTNATNEALLSQITRLNGVIDEAQKHDADDTDYDEIVEQPLPVKRPGVVRKVAKLADQPVNSVLDALGVDDEETDENKNEVNWL